MLCPTQGNIHKIAVNVVDISANSFRFNEHDSAVMLPVTDQLSESQFKPTPTATPAPSRLGLKAGCRFTMLFGVWGSMLLCVAPSAVCSSIKGLKRCEPTLQRACCCLMLLSDHTQQPMTILNVGAEHELYCGMHSSTGFSL